MRILHPVAINVAILVRYELDVAGFYLVQCFGCKIFHLEEPLCGELRLDDSVSPLGITDRRSVILDLLQTAGLFKKAYDLLPCSEAVLANQNLSLFVETSVVVDDVDNREIVPQTDFVVVGIMGRCDLEAACTEIHFDIFIFYNRDFLVDERDDDLLALEPEMPLVRRIDTDGRIRHDCLGTGRRNHKILVGRIALAVGNIVAEMIEMALGVLVDNLVVADGSEGYRIPVDHAHSPVDQTFLVEMAEGSDDCCGKVRIHCEPGPVPVAGGAEFAQLLEDDSAMFLFPLPGIFHEFVPGQVVLGNAHPLESGHHLAFGCDGSVVSTGNPAGVLAVHPGLSDKHIIEGVV